MKRKYIEPILITAMLITSLIVPAVAGSREVIKAAPTDEAIPAAVQEAAEKYGKIYCISPELLEAIAFQESTFNPKAVNGSCIGLMQINPECHRERMEKLGVTDLYNIDQSMRTAADYLYELFVEKGDIAYVLDSYNGNSRAEDLYDRGELSPYAREITERTREYEQKHGK